MLVEIGRILHKFWSDIAKNQRYAIHAPDIYENALNQITPHLGGITLKEILIATSFALMVRIPAEVSSKLEEIAKL